MKDRSDQDWLRDLKKNDPEAWSDLLDWIYRWAYAIIKGEMRTQENIDSAVSATYEQIWVVGIPRYRFEGSFLGYCRTITVHECLGVIRKIRRAPRHQEIKETIPFTVEPPKTDAAIIWERLQPCLDRLRTHEREILLQIDLDGVEPSAVAEQWNIMQNYVNLVAWRARRAVQKCMQERGYQNRDDVTSL